MPEVLNQFPVLENRRYDWETLLDGQVWRLVRGEDFDPSVSNFRIQVYRAARLKGLKARTQLDGDDSLVIQAVTPG